MFPTLVCAEFRDERDFTHDPQGAFPVFLPDAVDVEGDDTRTSLLEDITDARAFYQRQTEREALADAETGAFRLSEFREGLERLERQDAAPTQAELIHAAVE